MTAAIGSKEPSTPPGAVGRRLGVGLIDQLVSSGTNLAISLFAARHLDESEFGLFGVVMIVYLLAISSIRSLVGEPALVHEQESPDGSQIVPAAIIGAGWGLTCLAASAIVGGVLGGALVALGLAMPLLAIQDTCRYIAFSLETPRRALEVDVVWAVALLVIVPLASRDVGGIFGAWTLAGSVAGVVGIVRRRHDGSPMTLRWLTTTWYLSSRYLISFLATFGAAYLAVLAFGLVGDAEGVGAVRGVQILVSPLSLVVAATLNILSVHVARRDLRGRALLSTVAKVSLAAASVAVVATAVMLLTPRALGVALLGASWDEARRLLLPAGLQMIMIGLWLGPKVALIGRRRVDESVRLDLCFAPLLLVAPAAAGASGGAASFYWMLAAVHVAMTGAWWWRIVVTEQRNQT